MKRLFLGVTAVLAALVLTACGIPVDTTPRTVDPPAGPFKDLSTAESTPAARDTIVGEIYLVHDDALARVMRRLPPEATTDALVRDLLAGPTSTEREAGLSTALTGLAIDVRVDRGIAVVKPNSSADTQRNDQVLAFGQIVCTLGTRPDVTGVVFVRDGQPLGVPRADGSLSTGPLTTADYASLITSN